MTRDASSSNFHEARQKKKRAEGLRTYEINGATQVEAQSFRVT